MTKHRPPPVAIKVAISDAILKHMEEQIENKAPLHEMFPLCANNIIGDAIDKVFEEYQSSELARIEAEQQKIIDTLKGVSNG